MRFKIYSFLFFLSILLSLNIISAKIVNCVDDTPIALFHFEDGDAFVRDSCGSLIGDIYGSYSWGEGKYNNSLYFTGDSTYVNFYTQMPRNFTEMTISVWVKVLGEGFAGYQIFVQRGTYYTDERFFLSTDYFEFMNEVIFASAGNNIASRNGTINILDGQFHNIVGVFNGSQGNISVYYDGVYMGSSYANSVITESLENPLLFGVSSDDPMFLNGTLDEIAIWDRALSQEEVTALYQDIPCINPNITLILPSYPFLEINKNYFLELLNFSSGFSNIKITIDNETYDMNYNPLADSYSINLSFDKIKDYSFVIYGDGVCPSVVDNITGTFLVRQPIYITIRGYNNKTGGLFTSNKYINEFSYIIAEYSDKKYYDTTLEKYITPLGFKYTYQTPVYHTPYRSGEAILKVYDNDTSLYLRLIDGNIIFLGDYGVFNMSESYGTNIYLGKININGTNQTLEFLITNDDLYPYSKFLNWATAGLIALVFFASLVLLIMFPNTPAFALIFGILFSLAIIFIRVVLFVFGY